MLLKFLITNQMTGRGINLKLKNNIYVIVLIKKKQSYWL